MTKVSLIARRPGILLMFLLAFYFHFGNPWVSLAIGLSFLLYLFYLLFVEFNSTMHFIILYFAIIYNSIHSKLGVNNGFLVVMLILFCNTLWKFRDRKVIAPKEQNKKLNFKSWYPASLIFLTAIFISGAGVFLSQRLRLASLLRSYDFVAHSFIMREISLCGVSLINCDYSKYQLPRNDFFVNYPDMYHGFFASVFAKSLASDQTYLFAFSITIFVTCLFTLAILHLAAKKIMSQIATEDSKEILLSNNINLRVWYIFCSFGFIPFLCLKGYPNFVFSLCLIAYGIYQAYLRNFQWTSYSWLIAAEIWPATFLPLGCALGLLVFLNRKVCNIWTSISVGLFSVFIFLWLSDNLSGQYSQSSVLLEKSNHWLEPVLTLPLFFLLWKYGTKIRKNDPLIILLFALETFCTLFFVYLLYHGVFGSYYLYKLSLVIYLFLVFAWVLNPKKDYVFSSEIFISLTPKFEMHSINFSKTILKKLPIVLILISTAVLALPIQIYPTFLQSLRSQIGYPPTVSDIARSWMPDKNNKIKSQHILQALHQIPSKKATIFNEKLYGYQSSQWLNNLNLSWNTEIQNDFDSWFVNEKQVNGITDISKLNLTENQSRELLFLTSNCTGVVKSAEVSCISFR